RRLLMRRGRTCCCAGRRRRSPHGSVPTPTADTCRRPRRQTCPSRSWSSPSSPATWTCRRISSPCSRLGGPAARTRCSGTSTCRLGSRCGRSTKEASMQGTIKEFDEARRTGSLLTDDRTEIAIDERSLTGDLVRTLRFGQRVRFDVVEQDGTKVARGLTLATFE